MNYTVMLHQFEYNTLKHDTIQYNTLKHDAIPYHIFKLFYQKHKQIYHNFVMTNANNQLLISAMWRPGWGLTDIE